MLKIFIVYFSLLFVCSTATAAVLSGLVVDKETNEPVKNATIEAYRYDTGNEWWNWQASVVSANNGRYSFEDLPAGRYYFNIYGGTDYRWQYYQNTQNWYEKIEVVLDGLTDARLRKISLEQLPPPPYEFMSVSARPNAVLPEGGNVRLTVKVMNNTDQMKTLKFWAIANSSYSDVDNPEHYYYAYYPVRNRAVIADLMPGENTISLRFDVPPEQSSGYLYGTIYGGESFVKPNIWNPLGFEIYKYWDFGGLSDTDQYSTKIEVKHSERNFNDVGKRMFPLRVAPNGEVLLKGEVLTQ